MITLVSPLNEHVLNLEFSLKEDWIKRKNRSLTGHLCHLTRAFILLGGLYYTTDLLSRVFNCLNISEKAAISLLAELLN